MIAQHNIQTQYDLSRSITLWLAAIYPNSSLQMLEEDCRIIISRIKVLVYEYCSNSHRSSEVNFQLLCQNVNQVFTSLPQYYIVFNPGQITKTKGNSLFQIVIVPVVEYYVKSINYQVVGSRKNNIEYCLDNLYRENSNKCNTNNTGITECICFQNSVHVQASDAVFCYRCGRLFHKKCFSSIINQLFQCPFCFLQYCLPERQVIKTLFQGYIPSIEFNQFESSASLIDLDYEPTYLFNQSLSVQLRCTRLSASNYQYQITWPEMCDIFLDECISVSYKPLNPNSPLKKRHDSFVKIPLNQLVNAEKIKIVEYPAGVNAWHLVTMVAVKQRDEKYVFSKIIRDPFHSLSEAQSKQYLNSLFEQSIKTGLQMQRLVISNKCQFYSQKIVYPCRSRFCTNHYQPFDLYSFICSSVQAKSSIKRWRCPICGVRAYDIVVDRYLQKLMAQKQRFPKQLKNEKFKSKECNNGVKDNTLKNNSMEDVGAIKSNQQYFCIQ